MFPDDKQSIRKRKTFRIIPWKDGMVPYSIIKRLIIMAIVSTKKDDDDDNDEALVP